MLLKECCNILHIILCVSYVPRFSISCDIPILPLSWASAPQTEIVKFAWQDASAELGVVLGLSEGEIALAAQKAAVHAANVVRQRAADPAPGGLPPHGGVAPGGPPIANVTTAGGAVIWVVWAEAHLERISPSLLLGYALLASRRESALFLRMATGFGFAQVRVLPLPPAPVSSPTLLHEHRRCAISQRVTCCPVI